MGGTRRTNGFIPPGRTKNHLERRRRFGSNTRHGGGVGGRSPKRQTPIVHKEKETQKVKWAGGRADDNGKSR